MALQGVPKQLLSPPCSLLAEALFPLLVFRPSSATELPLRTSDRMPALEWICNLYVDRSRRARLATDTFHCSPLAGSHHHSSALCLYLTLSLLVQVGHLSSSHSRLGVVLPILRVSKSFLLGLLSAGDMEETKARFPFPFPLSHKLIRFSRLHRLRHAHPSIVAQENKNMNTYIHTHAYRHGPTLPLWQSPMRSVLGLWIWQRKADREPTFGAAPNHMADRPCSRLEGGGGEDMG
ncbi:hypothetical protein V8C26DRAFT_72176 [Trichoderma gracile]